MFIIFLKKHWGPHSLGYQMHYSVSNINTSDFLYFTHVTYRPLPTIKTVKLRSPNCQSFSDQDLARLKDERKWLSDTHVNFFLLFVFFLFVSSPLYEWNSHWYQDCQEQNIWGNVKICLLDTIFWPKFSTEPENFRERSRRKINLLEYHFAVMPMFEV